MEINRNNVMDIVNKCGLKPDKDYGQNFLIDPSISQKIVSALEILPNDKILEIGPGIGSLTHFLNLQSSNLTVVDIDSRMINFLKIPYNNSNITFINQDVRKIDVKDFDKVISNLPYNITTETIIYLLKNSLSIQKMVLMCQSENYAHFSDISGKEYGPVSILIHLIGSIKRVCNVKPGSFYPSPKCSSTVFVIDLNKDIDVSNAISTYLISKQLFLNRRKTIFNNLFGYLKDKDLTLSILNKLNIPLNKRPEELSPDVFANISKEIINK